MPMFLPLSLPAILRGPARHRLPAGVLALGALLSPAAQALDLFDPALGSPAAQGWAIAGSGTAAQQSLTAGAWLLDTTGSGVVQAGAVRLLGGTAPLDAAAGYTLSFTLQVLDETHDSANRAGFSVLLGGADPRQSLELGFHEDRVFAQVRDSASADGMVAGPTALLDTTVAHAYVLRVLGDGWTLSADGQALMSGTLQDYRAAGLPYGLPNLVFVGDDTSRAAARVALGTLGWQAGVASAVPEPAAAWLAAGGAVLVGLGVRRRGRPVASA
jgi:hypothetical protein